ncbi:methyltransferase type 11 [Fusarium flagelliforme]|uniref:Methyltransferase type 11 n=1 Tax=Fusarium flagelliforme TaxID=2675880 RepID=A0A395ME85_9HYPO|nr:methyltransferase type 11 [Fusarium flagelliforme]
MQIDAIPAWINNLDPPSPSTFSNKHGFADIDICDTLNGAKRRLSGDSMESPSKRKRTEDRQHAQQDPEKTPQAPVSNNTNDIFDHPPPSFNVAGSTVDSTDATSIFTKVLDSRPHLPFRQASQQRNQRSPSPSKQYRKRSDLHRLNHPIRFSMESDLRKALPSDAHDLYDALQEVQWGSEILPHALKDRPNVEIPNARRAMWQPADETLGENAVKSLVEKHSRFEDIVRRTKQSTEWGRSEAAWNSHIHYPVLHMLAETPSVMPEDITSARIVPRFRPCFITVDDDVESASSTSSRNTSATSNTSVSRAHTTKSVHKMVDFALALEPDEQLAAIIKQYTHPLADGTVNQTAYGPLKNRPAPVFIETKTSAGNLETSGVQLGVWVAAWHESLRSIMRRGGAVERIITVPLIQVSAGSWTIMFAVDGGNEVQILYAEQAIIGNSGSLTGMYQLQTAFKAIADWMEGPFKTWITQVLTRTLTQP